MPATEKSEWVNTEYSGFKYELNGFKVGCWVVFCGGSVFEMSSFSYDWFEIVLDIISFHC